MRNHSSSLLCSAALALTIGFAAPSTFAQDADDAQTDKLARAVEAQGRKLAAEEKALKAQEKKLEADEVEFDSLKTKVEKLTGRKIATAKAGAAAEATTPAAAEAGAASAPAGVAGGVPQEIGTDRKAEQEAPKPPETAKYIEEGGVLLPKGELLITPGIEYDRSSATNVAIQGFSIIPAINIGDFQISKVDQDTLIGSVDALLGVTNRFELEVKVPYVYGYQDTLGQPIGAGSSTQSLTSIDGNGIGDLEFAAHYQINKGQNDWPYFIANLRYKADNGTGPFQIPVNGFGQETALPTGSGFNAIQPSVTVLYPSDPVVFYGNVGYTHSFERSFASYGTIAPGDSVLGSFGMSTSLNDSSSFSLGYSHTMVFDTKQNGAVLPGSEYLQVGSVDVGWSYIFNDKVSLNINASIGVTDDAPSDRIVLRVPVAFDVF